MPIYEYRCVKCGATFEKFIRSLSGAATIECPQCHSTECQKNVSLFGTSSNGSSRSVSAAPSCAPSG